MKKILCVLLSLIMSVSLIAIPLSAQAETKYWVDMNFAKNNIEGLRNYIKTNGKTNSDGDKYIQYVYENKYNYLIIYETKTGALDFWAEFDDGEYVDMYYAYPNVNPELLVDLGSSYVLANANFDVNYYNYQDINLTVTKAHGDYSNEQVQYYGNLSLKAAIEGWNNCLVNNTPYTLASIGFNSLCNHNLTRSYYAATLNTDGTIEDYCYKCGYHEDTDIPCVSQVKLSKKSFTYNGKVQKPSVTVKDSKGKALKNGTDYTVSYPKGMKNVGKYTVKVTLKGNYSGTKSLTYNINPKGTSVSKVTAAKKGFKVTWKKQTTQTTGYQVQYSTSSKFKSAKTVTISKNKTTSKSVGKLSAKKKYYVRVRTYKTVKIAGKSVNLYSGWSKAKSVTTKK